MDGDEIQERWWGWVEAGERAESLLERWMDLVEAPPEAAGDYREMLARVRVRIEELSVPAGRNTGESLLALGAVLAADLEGALPARRRRTAQTTIALLLARIARLEGEVEAGSTFLRH